MHAFQFVKQPIRWRHSLEGKSGHVGTKPSWSEIFSPRNSTVLTCSGPNRWDSRSYFQGEPKGRQDRRLQRPREALDLRGNQCCGGSSRKNSARWTINSTFNHTLVIPFDSKTETVVSLNR